MRQIKDSVVLITGADGGIGSNLLRECIARDAKKIYATGINIDALNLLQKHFPDKVVPVKLDVTNIDDVIACHAVCHDTDILINNAGVECATRFLGDKSLKAAKFEMGVNYFGVHNLCHTFWNSLKDKPAACIVNVLSVASFILIMKLGTYCASKAAAHFLTQSLRVESQGTNISVFGVYSGYVDTAMTENIKVEKATPQQIAIEICDGIEAGILDIFTDKMAKELALEECYQNRVYTEFKG